MIFQQLSPLKLQSSLKHLVIFPILIIFKDLSLTMLERLMEENN